MLSFALKAEEIFILYLGQWHKSTLNCQRIIGKALRYLKKFEDSKNVLLKPMIKIIQNYGRYSS